MHHLINEFRPHQARETLRVMLHVQKRKRMQVAERFQANLDKVQETIEEALRALPEADESTEDAATLTRDGGGAVMATVDIGQTDIPSAAFAVSRTSANDAASFVVDGQCANSDRALCLLADLATSGAQDGNEESGEAMDES
jgi:hypothetical protein